MTILKLRGRSVLLSGALVAVSATCAGDGATGPTAPTPVVATVMEATTSTALSGTAGTRAAVAPSVLLKDATGRPVEGVLVSFAVSPGGGTIGSNSARTDGNGAASVGEWMLSAQVGKHTVTATHGALSNVVFTAAVAPGPAARIMSVSGYNQSAPIGSALPTPLTVRVADVYGNPIAGVPVTFVVESGGGTISDVEVITDPAGSAVSGAWTLGPSAGPQVVTARTGSLQMEFTAHGISAVCESSGSCGVSGQIAFTRLGNIYRANADGTGVMLLVTNGHFPAWSPDGSRIAFSREVGFRHEIYVVNADGSGLVRRAHTPGRTSWAPAWSPDGRKLAFTGTDVYGDSKIYMVTADEDGTAPVLFFAPPTKPVAQYVSPVSWSPDGAKIAFMMSGGVHILNADGTGLTQLATPPWWYFAFYRLAWSPDGRSLAVTTEANCDWENACDLGLAIVDAKTAAVTNLVVGSRTNHAWDPAWSPDGKTIMYTHWVCPSACIESLRFIKADGSAQGAITEGTSGAWRP